MKRRKTWGGGGSGGGTHQRSGLADSSQMLCVRVSCLWASTGWRFTVELHCRFLLRWCIAEQHRGGFTSLGCLARETMPHTQHKTTGIQRSWGDPTPLDALIWCWASRVVTSAAGEQSRSFWLLPVWWTRCKCLRMCMQQHADAGQKLKKSTRKKQPLFMGDVSGCISTASLSLFLYATSLCLLYLSENVKHESTCNHLAVAHMWSKIICPAILTQTRLLTHGVQ